MSKPASPYRAPAPRTSAVERVRPDDDGLDAAAFSRRTRRQANVEASAAVERAQRASRQLRLRAAVVLAVGLCAMVFAVPALWEHAHVRGLVRFVVVGFGMVGWSSFALVTGTGGAESVESIPNHLKAGQVAAPIVAVAIGLLWYSW